MAFFGQSKVKRMTLSFVTFVMIAQKNIAP